MPMPTLSFLLRAVGTGVCTALGLLLLAELSPAGFVYLAAAVLLAPRAN
ncbi:hypothetical protein [Streptomyces sp. NPDC058620]